MPVPDSYSRRYGREETTYTSSYTTRGNRASYLSSYSSAKQSSSLPPRPPSLYGSDALRKYGDPTSSLTSRYLTSSSSSSRIRDYGSGASGGAGSYRTSVSPVRATTTSALRASIADRLKAIELEGKDDETPLRSYSRYTTIRSRDPVSSPSIGVSRAYTSTYARDRSNSREYGVSPLSVTGTSASSLSNSHPRERDTSLTRSCLENARKRGSPSPPSAGANNGCSRNESGGSGGVVTNGLSSSEVKITSSSSSSSQSAICASNKGVIATSFTTTTKKPLVTTTTTSCTDSDTTDNSLVNVDSNNTADVIVGEAVNPVVSDSSCACNQCPRDFENNDVDCNVESSPSGDTKPLLSDDDGVAVTNTAISPEELTSTSTSNSANKNSNHKSLGMVMMNNGNSSGDDESGRKKDSNPVGLVLVQESRNSKKVKSVPSSSSSALKETVIGDGGGGGGVAPACSPLVGLEGTAKGEHGPLGTSSSAPSNSTVLSSSSTKVMENDSNGNPIMDSHSNGNIEPPEVTVEASTKAKMNSHNCPSKPGERSSSGGRVHRKSGSPGVASGASGSSHTSSSSKYLNGSEGSNNVNDYEMGPHTSKFAYPPVAESPSSLATNRNDKKSRYPRLNGASAAVASDSSDNDSDAFSSSPQLGGRFRSREGHERAGLTGLRNIGNTCFMNSVLQCLSNTKPLLEYVIRDNYQQDINNLMSGMKGCLIRAFSEVIQELWREQRVVDTSAFKDQIQKFAPRFMGYSQQDAQEFLRYLLEGLHEEVNRVTAKPTPILTDIDDSLSDSQKAAEAWKRYLRYEDSRIVDIFVGQLRSTLKCTVCGNCSVTFDPFWDLSLPIPARSGSTRLAQCFELLTKEEVLDGDEKPTCSKCQCRRKCTKSFSIQKFPRILVIHLKRFSPTERYRGKLSTLVDCPINSMDVSPYAANRGQALTYNLYGVANHSGSTYSGHYIAYCKHPYSGEWHSYNDSRVSPISQHQVITTEGYVLFYEQQNASS